MSSNQATYTKVCSNDLELIVYMQWNLSITDTLGPEKQFVTQRYPLLRGYFTCIAIYLVPQKQSVIERLPLVGEFVIIGAPT